MDGVPGAEEDEVAGGRERSRRRGVRPRGQIPEPPGAADGETGVQVLVEYHVQSGV